MRAVDVETLGSRLSEYVRLAAAGEVILITDQDRVVAELRAPSALWKDDTPDAPLADAIRAGLIRRAVLPSGPPPTTAMVGRLEHVPAALDDARGDR